MDHSEIILSTENIVLFCTLCIFFTWKMFSLFICIIIIQRGPKWCTVFTLWYSISWEQNDIELEFLNGFAVQCFLNRWHVYEWVKEVRADCKQLKTKMTVRLTFEQCKAVLTRYWKSVAYLEFGYWGGGVRPLPLVQGDNFFQPS